jgi:hypothetical protein
LVQVEDKRMFCLHSYAVYCVLWKETGAKFQLIGIVGTIRETCLLSTHDFKIVGKRAGGICATVLTVFENLPGCGYLGINR